MGELTGEQVRRLTETLVPAFSREALARMARTRLEVRPGDITGPGDLQQVTFELVEWAEQRGRLIPLIGAGAGGAARE